MNTTLRTRIFLSLSLAALLVGCATTDPYTGEERMSRTGSGTAVGAAAGAVIGAISGGDRLERAAIGAGIGALTGAAVGNYMDRQEAVLREQLRGTGVSVTRRGDRIILNMPGNVTFATDSSDLRSEFFAVLDSVALVLEEYEQTVLVVDGHTDSTGPNSYNQRLSEARAETVADYLINRGVRPVRIEAYGYGEDYPVASNGNAEGRRQNRRVELTLIPIS
ncbi:OmpA family protein [Wenzhouxiangella sp. XN79A]|uniref:OmpA family protein n=1 Tax=Wenzhouxiangella sp. XN79A TaxID=2724193 RepID=UPI00144AB45E|nr:OmpA family protein [Wenzhouxiangella sp. XN79A]NKI34696.1 OmpA family protein [Wenzhouxiangella sp. XN79A]